MTTLFIILSLLTLWFDYRFWRGRSSGIKGLPGLIFRLFLLLTALIPLLITCWGKWLAHDNPPLVSLLWMWLLWLFLFTVPTRQILYLTQGRTRWLRWSGVILASLLAIALLDGAIRGRTHLRVVEEEILSERLPEGWNGARILLLSDLHVGTMLHPERESRALVERVQALKPDLVLFAGDLVHIRHSELTPALMQILAEIRPPLGVYSVLGNHDVGFYIRDSIRLPHAVSRERLLCQEREMGWQVLSNEERYLVRGGDSIRLIGIDFNPLWRHLRHDRELPSWGELERLLQRDSAQRYTIALSHLPQLWEEILRCRTADLTLSGHVHSMQHKLRIGPRGLSLARLLYPHWSGRYEEQGQTLYINDGIGTVGIPARMGASPEITLFTLRSLQSSATE